MSQVDPSNLMPTQEDLRSLEILLIAQIEACQEFTRTATLLRESFNDLIPSCHRLTTAILENAEQLDRQNKLQNEGEDWRNSGDDPE